MQAAATALNAKFIQLHSLIPRLLLLVALLASQLVLIAIYSSYQLATVVQTTRVANSGIEHTTTPVCEEVKLPFVVDLASKLAS
jgi:hypothetical protein